MTAKHSKDANEFDEWAKRFEARTYNDYTQRQTITEPPKCMYPMTEGTAQSRASDHRASSQY